MVALDFPHLSGAVSGQGGIGRQHPAAGQAGHAGQEGRRFIGGGRVRLRLRQRRHQGAGAGQHPHQRLERPEPRNPLRWAQGRCPPLSHPQINHGKP